MMKITLLIGALAVAKATVPDAVEACFVENGVSWNNHAPETAEQCLEHCDLMCGACKEITLENAADPGVLGALPEPPADAVAHLRLDPPQLVLGLGELEAARLDQLRVHRAVDLRIPLQRHP